MISRKKLANAIRIISIDCIEKAKSGHPGSPMGMADIAEVLWRDYMNHNPLNPEWINRDRFILSNGHASILLYSILHLTGYNITLHDLKNFRQLYSKTPGHPEYKKTEGIEITTGPLGQGLANAVGFAIAEKTLGAQFNQPKYNIIDHYTYVFAGDGCMMEGISHEACSLAGNMKLGKLIVFYDSNNITIDGKISQCCSDNTYMRFKSYGWHVIDKINGHNHKEIKKAIKKAKSITKKPSLLICKTIIAFGSPNKSGKKISHGTPLGKNEIIAVRKFLNWKHKAFIIPNKIYKLWDARKNGIKKEKKWNKKFSLYKKNFPKLYKEFIRRIHKKLPLKWKKIYKNNLKNIQNIRNIKNINNINIATRKASQNTLEILGPILPELIGGSADLTTSNLTSWSKSIAINQCNKGNYIHYGVREFGMTAIGNGIACYNGFIPYTSTFLTFSDYARNAIRMAALMKIHHIMIYTHDSIGVGEDGPTHQPIEQISNFRNIPNLNIWRPCDYIETFIAWKKSIEKKEPTIIVLSRQNTLLIQRKKKQIKNIKKGGYILRDSKKTPKLIIISTGSEISISYIVWKILNKKKYQIRLVSIPSTNIFDKQKKSYKKKVLPPTIKKRIIVEASYDNYWYKYINSKGKIIGIKKFGESGAPEMIFNLFGFTIKNIISKIKKIY